MPTVSMRLIIPTSIGVRTGQIEYKTINSFATTVIASPILLTIAIARLGLGSVGPAESNLSSCSGSSDHGGNAAPSQRGWLANSSILLRQQSSGEVYHRALRVRFRN